MLTNRDTSNWMRKLASHYGRMRTKYPNDRLIVLFDIDGTIVDLRHMVLRLLREYDQRRGTSHFRGLGLFDIIYNTPDLESFLKAALLLPTSLTADFDFDMRATNPEAVRVCESRAAWVAGN